MKYLIVGLGNIGDEYETTRHNIGFKIADNISEKIGSEFELKKHAFCANGKFKGRNIYVIKPSNFVNNSGKAVRDIYNSLNLIAKEICIILDDVDLPLGSLRIKPKGGDGSHRGLESIICSLHTNEFPRLRFGIGTNEEMRPAENYVLKPFGGDDKLVALESVKKAADALDSILFNGIEKTMNKINS